MKLMAIEVQRENKEQIYYIAYKYFTSDRLILFRTYTKSGELIPAFNKLMYDNELI